MSTYVDLFEYTGLHEHRLLTPREAQTFLQQVDDLRCEGFYVLAGPERESKANSVFSDSMYRELISYKQSERMSK